MKTPCRKCGKTVDEHFRLRSGMISCDAPPPPEEGVLHFATSFYMPADYAAGYEAGLRRAQELANKLIDVDYIEVFADFNQAIDAEVSKR